MKDDLGLFLCITCLGLVGQASTSPVVWTIISQNSLGLGFLHMCSGACSICWHSFCNEILALTLKFGLKILGSTHALSRTSHKAVIPTALIVTVPHVTAPLRGSASQGYRDSNWGLLSAPLGDSMTVIINSWIPSVLIEKSSYQKLSFWDQTAIKSPLIIFWWV